jgi:hypothetical protein
MAESAPTRPPPTTATVLSSAGIVCGILDLVFLFVKLESGIRQFSGFLINRIYQVSATYLPDREPSSPMDTTLC